MLILLPPSESKAPGGSGRRLDLGALSFPALTPMRRQLIEALAELAARSPDQLSAALGLTASQRSAIDADASVTTSGTLPALQRYTGVLYEALDYASLQGSARRRANHSLVVASALFGLVRPGDRLPAYRLSATTRLPGLGGLAALWRPLLEPELTGIHGLVVDLRSGSYAALARLPGAIEVRVLRDNDGLRSVVSHDNKWTKGRLARALCESGARTVADVAAAGRPVADLVEVDAHRVDLVLTGLARSRPHTVLG